MEQKAIEALKEAGVLFPPCKIGDTVYGVFELDDENSPSIEKYIVTELLYDGEKWYAGCGDGTYDEFGTDGAILDIEYAVRRFREIRDGAKEVTI